MYIKNMTRYSETSRIEMPVVFDWDNSIAVYSTLL